MFGGWPPSHNISTLLPPYIWVVSGSFKTLGLGVFTFISGYVLYYQVYKKESFCVFLQKKIKRILLSCITVACIYWIIFPDFMDQNKFPAFINGTHLWYLPMIFLVTVTTSILIFYPKYGISVIVFSYVIAILLKTVNTTASGFVTYLPVFLCGFYFNKCQMQDRLIKTSKLFRGLVVFVGILFPCLYEFVANYYGFAYHLELQVTMISVVTYSVVAFTLVTSLVHKKRMHSIISNLASNSFFIYLSHQFVINFMLIFISFSNMGFYSSFTIIFIIAFFVSWCLSNIFDIIRSRFSKIFSINESSY